MFPKKGPREKSVKTQKRPEHEATGRCCEGKKWRYNRVVQITLLQTASGPGYLPACNSAIRNAFRLSDGLRNDARPVEGVLQSDAQVFSLMTRPVTFGLCALAHAFSLLFSFFVPSANDVHSALNRA